jgi:hypothetical protein
MRRKENERPEWLSRDNRYKLLVPVDYKVGETTEKVTELQLRRLTGVELLILDGTGSFSDKLMQIIQGMTDLPRVVVARFDAVDLDRLDDIFGYFREPGSVTGAIS